MDHLPCRRNCWPIIPPKNWASGVPRCGVETVTTDRTARAQRFLEKLGIKSKSPALTNLSIAALSDDQVITGLKEALGKGVQNAVGQLGRADGFLTNLNVKIPMPENLQKVEKTLRSLKQDHLADEFITTMNHAAEQAVPEAAGGPSCWRQARF